MDKRRIPTLQAKISELTATNEQAATEKDALSRELRRLQQRYTDADQRSATTQAKLAQLRQEHGLTQQELLRQCARTSRIEDKEKDLQVSSAALQICTLYRHLERGAATSVGSSSLTYAGRTCATAAGAPADAAGA